MGGLGVGQRLEVVCAEGVQERDREDRDGGNLDHSRGGHAILAVAGPGWAGQGSHGNSGRLRMWWCRSART